MVRFDLIAMWRDDLSSSRIFQLPFVGNIWPLPMGGPLLVPVAVNCNEPDLEEDLEAGSCATGTTVTVPSSLSVPVAVKSNKPDPEEDWEVGSSATGTTVPSSTTGSSWSGPSVNTNCSYWSVTSVNTDCVWPSSSSSNSRVDGSSSRVNRWTRSSERFEVV